MCNLCFRYITSQITTWETACPSVLFSLCIQKPSAGYQKLFLKLPLQIEASWFFERLKIKLRKSKKPIFDDITRDQIQFTCLLETYLSVDYKLCMSRYPFPSVKCFCGASEFIEEAGFVGFHHLLNFIDNSFVSFGANWEKYLRCIRADYLDQLPKYIAFRCAPTIEITETGLSWSTCNSHKKGSALIMCHTPRHPSVGNISHTYSDRLAILVTTVRGATPVKIGEFSNTYFMSQSVGGRNGVGSLSLHSNRNLCVKSDYVLQSLESAFLTNRLDSKETLLKIASEYHLSDESLENLKSRNFSPNYSKVREAIKSATFIPISFRKSIKEYLDTETESGIIVILKKKSLFLLTIAHQVVAI